MIKTTRKYASKRVANRVARRIPRAVKSSTALSLRVEYDEQIFVQITGTQPIFLQTGLDYLEFFTILTSNPAFVAQTANFTRYKINGLAIMSSPCFTDTSSTAIFGIYGVPLCFIQQYPTLTSVSVGSECEFSDNNMIIKPYNNSSSKYWSYKQNYLIGTGNGVGTWNQCNQAGAQQGQISVRMPTLGAAAAASGSIFSIRVALYVTLDGKSR